MEQKIFVEKTEEERKEKETKGGIILVAFVLSIFGLFFVIDLLENYVSVDEMVYPQDFFLRSGIALVFLICLFIVYVIGRFIGGGGKYKEIELNNEQKKIKSTRRKK